MNKNCYYCQKQSLPDFKDVDTLKKFLTYRGKIATREKSGICAWHQRKLAREIKKARQLALIPFVVYEH